MVPRYDLKSDKNTTKQVTTISMLALVQALQADFSPQTPTKPPNTNRQTYQTLPKHMPT